MPRRVLIIDDEPNLAEMLAYNLWKAGYQTKTAHDGLAGLRELRDFKPDLVLLDLMMPGLTGQEVLSRIRADPSTASLPVILLTARNEEADELAGLGLGADDYITKPFSIKVVQARIESVLRRARGGDSAGPLTLGSLSLDPSTHEARINGQPLSLTLTEFRLLMALIAAEGKVLSRHALISHAMGAGVMITERTIDVHMTAIRKKLGPLAAHIKTVRGVGYRTEVPAESSPPASS